MLFSVFLSAIAVEHSKSNPYWQLYAPLINRSNTGTVWNFDNNILQQNNVDDSIPIACSNMLLQILASPNTNSNYTRLMLIITYESEFWYDFELAKNI